MNATTAARGVGEIRYMERRKEGQVSNGRSQTLTHTVVSALALKALRSTRRNKCMTDCGYGYGEEEVGGIRRGSRGVYKEVRSTQ